MISRPKFFAIVIILAIIVLIYILYIPGCNKPVKPVTEPTHTTAVITAYNPIIDSLAKENFNLKQENDSLKELTYKLTHKRNQSKATYEKEKVNTAVAEAKNDTASLVTSLKKQVAECDEYMQTTDQQLSVQGHIIENLEQQNRNSTAQIDLLKKSLKVCADENSSLAAKIVTSNKKADSEHAKKKAWRSAALGTFTIAVIEGLILSIK